MKNLFKPIIVLLLLSSITVTTYAQQGFGTNKPAASSVVDMTATNKGVLVPRVALTDIADVTTIPTAASNLLVFNTATAGTSPNNVIPGFYYWNGSVWKRLLNNSEIVAGTWSLTGNAGTIAGTNFVGTTDVQDLVFMTNSSERIRVTSTGSVGIGTTPNASAKVDVSSTTQGFLPPRMTAAQMAAIASPAEGMMVYNATLHCLAYYAKGVFNCSYNMPSPPTPTLGSSATLFYNGWVGATYTGSTTTVTHASGQAFSANTSCTSSPISVTGCGAATTVTGASGNVYPLKEINGQCWTAENMREVPSAFSNFIATSWLNTSTGDLGYWGYRNTVDRFGSLGWGTVEPTNAYGHEGLLYQWSAAMNGATAQRSRGICPSGFHVPSDCEFMYLEHGLGMTLADQINLGYLRGTATENVGGKLGKDASSNNASGFSALTTGVRSASTGVFNNPTSYKYLWSSSINGSLPVYRDIPSTYYQVYRGTSSPGSALPVRCLKD